MFDMFVVDLMHEFEIGVWKGLFIHLMRLLQAINPSLRHELDRRSAFIPVFVFSYIDFCRYRLIPTFGKDTIRRFSANSSDMKKMAAHNFEDLLQVCNLAFYSHLYFTKSMAVFNPCF